MVLGMNTPPDYTHYDISCGSQRYFREENGQYLLWTANGWSTPMAVCGAELTPRLTKMTVEVTMESILTEAERIVAGPRQESYGSPKESFGRIASMWSAYLGITIKDSDVCLMMSLLKICREKNKSARDNRVDIAGYIRLIDELR